MGIEPGKAAHCGLELRGLGRRRALRLLLKEGRVRIFGLNEQTQVFLHTEVPDGLRAWKGCDPLVAIHMALSDRLNAESERADTERF